MALNAILTRTYTRNVYLYGTYELHDNKGEAVPDIRPEYVDAVMSNAVATLTTAQIDNALATGYITQEEYDATLASVPIKA
jgi:hypothetical protein